MKLKTSMIRSDLLYIGMNDPTIAELRGQVENLVVEDASDFVHEERVQVTFPEMTHFDWYRLLLTTGLSSISFSFNLMTMGLKSEDLDGFHDLLKSVGITPSPRKKNPAVVFTNTPTLRRKFNIRSLSWG